MIESKLLMTETLVIRYNYCRIYMYRPDAIRLSWQPKKNVDFVNGGGVETPPKNDHSKWPPFSIRSMDGDEAFEAIPSIRTVADEG